MKILLIGPPACGKGTIGELLSEKLKLPLISVGQLLRDVPETDPRYERVHAKMDKGDLVSGEITSELLKDRLDMDDCKNGYILDGWCRKFADLHAYDPGFDMVLYLHISEDTVIKRISGRRICEATGEIFNVYTMSPEALKSCPSDIIQRADDREEVVKERLVSFKEETLPVIEHFRKQHLLFQVDAEPKPDEVFKNICKVLKVN
jgi:adenylate kinase